MGFFSDRVDDVFRALDKLRRGAKIGPQAETDIAWFERAAGFDRPLASYSPRSYRRYKQRFSEGATTKKNANKREYAARKESTAKSREKHALTPSQWKQIEPLRNRVKQLGVDVDPYMDDDVLKDVALLYGFVYMKTVLTNQVDSTEQYLKGNAQPGNRRWNARGELEQRFGASQFFNYAQGTNPYYFYHGRRK